MTKERRLGRGLEALLSQLPGETPPEGSEAKSAEDVPPGANSLLQLNVYEIDTNPFQPRTEFEEEEITALSESIREHGIIQPLVVRKIDQRYQLISGERRLRAAIRAGWQVVPAHLREADDREVSELTIVENLQRKDLNAIEKAKSFQRYLDQFGGTQEELARRLSVDRSTVANLIRLLELPEEVKQAVAEGRLTAGHARALLPLGEEPQQLAFAKRIVDQGLSVRATEELVTQTTQQADQGLAVYRGDDTSTKTASPRAQHLANLERELKTALGTKVQIRQTAKGKGRIVVHFANNEEFERLRDCLAGEPNRRRAAVGE